MMADAAMAAGMLRTRAVLRVMFSIIPRCRQNANPRSADRRLESLYAHNRRLNSGF